MTEEEKRIFLKKRIQKDVFVTSQERTIVTATGADEIWLFDFRKVLLCPEVLDTYAEIFYEKYKDLYPFQVGGLEVAAIPLVSAIVMKCFQKGISVNGFFIRKSRKKTGLLSSIEGILNEYPIILVDDILNTGGSFAQQVQILEKENHNLSISHIVTLLRFRDGNAYDFFHKKKIKVDSFFTLDDFTESLLVKNLEKHVIPDINPYKVLWARKMDGAHLWQVRVKAEIVLSEQKLFFGTDSGIFYCLDAYTGKEIWRYVLSRRKRNTEIFSSAAVGDNAVFFGAMDGNIYALSKETGKRLWVYLDADWVDGDVLYDSQHKTIIVTLTYGFLHEQTKLVALDVLTGKKKWEYPIKNKITKKILLHNGYVIFTEEVGGVISISSKDGSLFWCTKEISITHSSCPTLYKREGCLLVAGTSLFENEERGLLYFVSLATGKVIRKSAVFSYGTVNNPVVHEGYVLISSFDKYVYVVDLFSGNLLQSHYLGSRIFSDAVPYKDKKNNHVHFFIGANNAKLFEISITKNKIVSTTYFTERLTQNVLFCDDENVLYIKTCADEIAKISLTIPQL